MKKRFVMSDLLSVIRITGSVERVKPLYDKAKQENGDFDLFNTLIPQPDHISQGEHNDKISWNRENWGTGVDTYNDTIKYSSVDDSKRLFDYRHAKIEGYFESKWEPPIKGCHSFYKDNKDMSVILVSFIDWNGWIGFYENGSLYQYQINKFKDFKDCLMELPPLVIKYFGESLYEHYEYIEELND